MSYEVKFIPEAADDYRKLEGSIKKLANEKIDALKENPLLGDALGNKNNINLSEYYKIYIAKKSYRIVYRLLGEEEIEIVEIWGIGKRDKLEIYKTIGKRIEKYKK